MRQTVAAVLTALALVPVAASARATSVSPEMDRLLLEGLDAVYRMDFAAADEAARKAIALQPDYPHPYLGQAVVDFIRYSYGSERSDAVLTKSFQDKAMRAVAVATLWLKAHPKDADALLALGSGYGLSARLALDRHQWIRGWRDGSRAIRYIRDSLRADPEIYDSYVGLGMFDYYVATIPRFAGWLAKIMLGGDRRRGVKELQLASEKGRYARVAAQLILVEIFAEDDFGARNPPEAARLMADVRGRYPDSPMLHSAGIVALYENRDFDAAVRESREYLSRAQSGKYPVVDIAKGRALLGTVLWGLGLKEEALAEFRAGFKAAGPETRWAVWCRAREGQILDSLGRRDEALLAYKEAYAAPDLWDLRGVIKPCLSRPCVGANYPGHFSPY